MWENTVAIYNILKKITKLKIFNQINIKKVELTKIILKQKTKKGKSTVAIQNNM
jgi:hypothetical protein